MGVAPTVDELAAATPTTRDRTVDFLRAASMLVVALGHWLMAVVTVDDGALRGANAIALVPGLWLATWVLQVMPVFFFVGGFSNCVTLDSFHRRGARYSEFFRSRVQRLLHPVIVLLVAWTAVALALQAIGVREPMLRSTTKAITGPLWFVAVYIGVTALAPVMLRAHRRFGVWVLVALAASAVIVDVARLRVGLTAAGALNLAFVWLCVHQLGFFYADGQLLQLSRRTLARAAVGGIGALVALTQLGPYPGSMVGMPGERISNMGPPTICVLALTAFQVAGVLLIRPRLNQWLARPRPWKAVIAANSVLMTVFCWHLTAMILLVAAVHGLGIPLSAGGTAGWWLLRPVWIGLLAVALVPLVAAFARFERPTGPVHPGGSTGTAGVSAALLVVGIGGLAATGLAPLTSSGTVVAWSMTPVSSGACLLGGLMLTRTSEVRR